MDSGQSVNRNEATVCFLAVCPSVATAFRVHGDSGSRIQLDIDDSFIEQVKTLIDWRAMLLEVTVRPVPK